MSTLKKPKKIHKTITIGEVMLNQLAEMMTFYDQDASAMVRIALSELYGGKYRVARFGHQKGAEQNQRSVSILDQVADFEKLSNEEATEKMLGSGYYSEEELKEADYEITNDEQTGARIHRMTYKSGCGGMDQPFQAFLTGYKKFIRDNR